MLFFELRFFFFFAVVFGVHWALRSNTWRKAWLLVCSHFFYACFFVGGNPISFWMDIHDPAWLKVHPEWWKEDAYVGWWFPFVLMGSTCMDYAVGLGLAASKTQWSRKAWLLGSLGTNLGVLAFFKYYSFFAVSAINFLHWLHLPASESTLKIFLPYGISFYTFQSMSYSIDVYRRRLEPVRSFLDLAFFISFFPQVVAGPIVRAMTFLPQVFETRRWANVDVRGCVTLFFVGFFKKRCVSETVAPVVKEFFELPWKYNSYSAWVAVLFFAIQIYCDFSGYSDMAIACARLLGYELTINFNFPYFSKNVPEFWTRWHISLSTWLRDYLYIPLGGNRGTKAFTYRNLMLTMLIGGLWHGASWTFVIWGGMHGLALIVQREWQRLTTNASANVHRFIAWAAAPITFYWVCLTWIFFRAQDSFKELKDGKQLLQGTAFQVATCTLDMFVCFRGGDRGPKARSFGLACIPFIVGLAIIHWLCSRKVFATWWRNLPDWAYSAILGGAMALVLFFSPAKYSNFIYFKF